MESFTQAGKVFTEYIFINYKDFFEFLRLSPELRNPYFRLFILFLGILLTVTMVNILVGFMTKVLKIRLFFIKKSILTKRYL
jgi:hypothetical protein